MNSMSPAMKALAFIFISVLAGQSYMIYDLKNSISNQNSVQSEITKNTTVSVSDNTNNKSALNVPSSTPTKTQTVAKPAVQNYSTNSLHDSWDPFSEFQAMQQEFDKIFANMNSHFANDPFFKSAHQNSFSQPRLDISSNQKEYIVKMDIPGIDNSNLEINVEDNILSVRAEVNEIKESNSTTYISKERYVNRFQRSIALSDDADSDKMSSDYKDGVLTIKIPKK
jgi:HSP20 family protein